MEALGGGHTLKEKGGQQVISLNSLKKGADNRYHKLEIPVPLVTRQAAPAMDDAICAKRVEPMAMNSNCQLEFSYAFGQSEVVASLMGPSEAKFGSKQDY